jgi:hypothetical protein
MEIAYSDVECAFDHFLRTSNRPIIIASHSQGTMHAVRLMDKFHHDPGLRGRLVCAYLLGPLGSIPADKFEKCFPSLHPCAGPLDTQCIVAFDVCHDKFLVTLDLESEGNWMIRNRNPDPPLNIRNPSGWESPAGKTMCCTNPLTWTSEPGRAEAALYLGRAKLRIQAGGGPADNGAGGRQPTGEEVIGIDRAGAGACWAEIVYDGGTLVQTQLEGAPADCHNEWPSYYFNIRENVAQRVDACLAN